MSYYIEKSFEAAVAHRVYNQYLNNDLRDNNLRPCPCKNIHGHTATFLVGLSSKELVNDMVLDFNMIGFVKKALDLYYDHRFTICKDDPLTEYLVTKSYNVVKQEAIDAGLIKRDEIDHYDIKLDVVEDLDGGEHYRCYRVFVPAALRKTYNPLVELLDSFTIMDFSTTSENLAHWMYNVVTKRLNDVCNTTNDSVLKEILKHVKVEKVSYKESPKSIAVYTE